MRRQVNAMAKLRKLTPEDWEILGRVVRDLGAKRTEEVALSFAGISDPGEFKSRKGDNLGAFRFIRDVLQDYTAICVLQGIKDLKPVTKGRRQR